MKTKIDIGKTKLISIVSHKTQIILEQERINMTTCKKNIQHEYFFTIKIDRILTIIKQHLKAFSLKVKLETINKNTNKHFINE